MGIPHSRGTKVALRPPAGRAHATYESLLIKAALSLQLDALRHSIAKLERVVSFAAEEVDAVREENLRVTAELEVLK